MKTPVEQWVLNNLELIDLPGMGKCELARIAFTAGEASGLQQAQEIMAAVGVLSPDAEEQQKQHWEAQQDQDEQWIEEFINNEV